MSGTRANIGRCTMRPRAARGGTRGKEGKGENVATLWAMLLHFGVSPCPRGAQQRARWWRKQRGLEVSSPLGRSCVNPLREAHTKLVPPCPSLFLLLFLFSPGLSLLLKGCRDCPYKRPPGYTVSLDSRFLNVTLRASEINRVYF